MKAKGERTDNTTRARIATHHYCRDELSDFSVSHGQPWQKEVKKGRKGYVNALEHSGEQVHKASALSEEVQSCMKALTDTVSSKH